MQDGGATAAAIQNGDMHACFIAQNVLKSRAKARLGKGVLVFDHAITEKYDRRASGLADRLGQNEAVLIRRYFVGLLN